VIPFPLALPPLRIVTLAAGMLAIAALATLLHVRTSQRDAAIAHAAAVQASFDRTVTGYRAAREQARRNDQLNIIRVGVQQAAISEKSEHDYQDNIDRLRADYARRLRAAETAADPGGSRRAAMPAAGPAPGGIDGAAGEARLPLADALIASEQAERLAALQAWVHAQAAIDMDAEVRSRAGMDDGQGARSELN